MLLTKFIESLASSVQLALHRVNREQIGHARRSSEELALEVEVGGQPLKVEGAANLPNKAVMPSSVEMETKVFLEQGDQDGTIRVHAKQRLFGKLPEVSIQISFEAGDTLESLELVRERANEVNRQHIVEHRQASHPPTNLGA